jgi:hypothetical protein
MNNPPPYDLCNLSLRLSDFIYQMFPQSSQTISRILHANSSLQLRCIPTSISHLQPLVLNFILCTSAGINMNLFSNHNTDFCKHTITTESHMSVGLIPISSLCPIKCSRSYSYFYLSVLIV